MNKYIPVTVSGIITQVAKRTEVKGYSEGILETFLPTDEELDKMNDAEETDWIKKNNIRMNAIIKFLNENNL